MNQSKSGTTAFFSRASDLDSSMFYMGSIMSFLSGGDDAGGRFALMEYRSKPGNEPPPHVHEWEDELFFVLDSEIDFYCGDQVRTVGAGGVVFLPQGVAHGFVIRSPSVRTLILVSAVGDHPVTLDTYFRIMSSPATTMELPPETVTYALDDPQHALAVGAAHGIRMLSPEEAAQALPCLRQAA